MMTAGTKPFIEVNGQQTRIFNVTTGSHHAVEALDLMCRSMTIRPFFWMGSIRI